MPPAAYKDSLTAVSLEPRRLNLHLAILATLRHCGLLKILALNAALNAQNGDRYDPV